ncbi:MAG: hypothetical protein U1E73_02740 [Planctomycetota bacterium]
MQIPPHAAPEGLVPYAPARTRRLPVFGATVEAVLLPQRAARSGHELRGKIAFAPSRAERIVRDEVLWAGDDLVLTPNRFPFAREHRLLWPRARRREPDRAMWVAIGAWAEAAGGSALLNTVGAAATIGRAHAHLVGERLPFLAALPMRPGPADLVDLPPGVELLAADLPFCLLVVRGGDADARASVLDALGEARLATACNTAVVGAAAYVYPRALETPAPHFAQALGAAELWGRGCYTDAAAFAAATGVDLELALVAGGMPHQPAGGTTRS